MATAGGPERSANPGAVERSVAELERALAKEIHRRGELEKWVAGQVESAMQREVGLVARNIRAQLTDVSGKTASDSEGRLTALEHDFAALGHRLERVEFALKSPMSFPGRSNPDLPYGSAEARALGMVESRVCWLEQHVGRPLETLPFEARKQLNIMRGEILDECHMRFQLALDSARADVKDMRYRLAELETWLRDAMTPGVVGLQVSLHRERLERERAFAKVAENFWELVPAGAKAAAPPGIAFVDAVAAEVAADAERPSSGRGSPRSVEEDRHLSPKDGSLGRFRQQLKGLRQEPPRAALEA